MTHINFIYVTDGSFEEVLLEKEVLHSIMCGGDGHSGGDHPSCYCTCITLFEKILIASYMTSQ